MQPQDSGDLGGWWHALSGTGGGALGAILAWIYRIARVEPKLELQIKDAEQRVEAKVQEAKDQIKEVERLAFEKVEEMTGHFQEAFAGIRQQINDVGKGSLPREEFNAFRKEVKDDADRNRRENREDFDKIDRKIDQILARHK